MKFFRSISLALAVSALCATEYSAIGNIVIIIVYASLFLADNNFLFAALIGLTNYKSTAISGGFSAGILICIWNYKFLNKKHSTILAYSSLILFSSITWIIINNDALDSLSPFNVKWWLDLGIASLVSLACAKFLDDLC